MKINPDIWTIPLTTEQILTDDLPCLLFQSKQELLLNTQADIPIPTLKDVASIINQEALQCYYLMDHQGLPMIVAKLQSSTEPPPSFEFQSMKKHLIQHGSHESLSKLALGWQVIDWYEQHQFCGVCGSPCKLHPKERSMSCQRCPQNYFPQISPCILVMVLKDDKILLANNANFPPDRYSHVAGFMEPAETPEETAQREVKEEVGINIKNIRYFTSQPWPFPRQLMLGFIADYDSGELTPDGIEIIDAQWFDRNHFPKVVPPAHTLSGQLLSYYYKQVGFHPHSE